MVNFNVGADFSGVNKMLSRYGQKASKEYKRALTRTSIFGLRELKKASPVVTGALKNTWKFELKGSFISNIINNINYVLKVNYHKRKPASAFTNARRIMRSKIDGYLFIDKTIPEIEKKLAKEINRANERILR